VNYLSPYKRVFTLKGHQFFILNNTYI